MRDLDALMVAFNGPHRSPDETSHTLRPVTLCLRSQVDYRRRIALARPGIKPDSGRRVKTQFDPGRGDGRVACQRT